ncbi:MAG: solute carrier family 26 protein [Bacteroidota bacterium]
MNWKNLIPAAEWLPGYSRSLLRKDLLAGLTVGVMLVPQGMAYAMLAGMPPIYGLYGGLVPLFLYGLLGTSRQLSVGPVAISSLLILAGISKLAEPGSQEYVELVILTGLMVGILQTLLGLFKVGALVNLLSHPVIIGFTSAAAVIIAINQLTYLFGMPIPRFEHSYETLYYACMHLSDIHWPTFLICISAILIILLLRKISRAIPSALLVTVLSIIIVHFFRLDTYGVDIVGKVPEGLPALAAPHFQSSDLLAIIPTVLTVGIMGIVESISIARVLESKNKDCNIRPNAELIALGLSKIGGAFFQAIPTSGSFTRSAVNNDNGAKTGMSSIITALLTGLTLIFLTPLFYALPKAALAAIILVAVIGLFNVKEARHLWHLHRQDFFMMLATFVATLALGIEKGVIIGVLLSLAMIIYRTSQTHFAVLGRLPNSNYYRNVERFKEAVRHDGILVLRFDAQLFFGNINHFKDTLMDQVEQQPSPVDIFILDASNINDIDSSGLDTLEEVAQWLHLKGIHFSLAGAIGPVRDLLYKSGLMQKIGQENQFLYVHEAVQYHLMKSREENNWDANAVQTNLGKEKKPLKK